MELLHQPEDIIGQRYRITETLGQGGSGTTYQAQDLQSGQPVALKVLSLHGMTDWKMMELFEREARILAKLDHPAIPRYLDYFQVDTNQDRTFYIAQQIASGQSLATLVQNGWQPTEDEVRLIAIQILEVLVYLHSLTPPVIHRDIKPQNIIRQDNGKVFLVDFGAVQDTYYHTLMRGGTVVGTHGYMAPEQFRGRAVPTTDLYGLGATLLFLLTRCSPADLPTKRLKIDFRSRVQVSPRFADWLQKMLEPVVEDRFPSAKEALSALRRQRTTTAKSHFSVPWKPVAGVGVAAVAAVTLLGSYKYAVLDILGVKPQGMCEAMGRGKTDMVMDYLKHGGNPNLKLDESDPSLLQCALQSHKEDFAKLLINKGADINTKSRGGTATPLQLAAARGWEDVAQLLIAKGADVNAKDGRGTALHYAVERGHSDLAELLIAKGAQVNTKNYQGQTPLHFAAQRGQSDLAELLIAKGAQVNARDNQGQTALNYAAQRGQSNLAELLIAYGAQVNTTNYQGQTPLHSAAESGQINLAQMLIGKGAEVNAQDNQGQTPLHYAAQRGQINLAELLIAKGAQVNTSNYQGYTPLHYAVERGQNNLAELLIAKGAQVNTKNYQGYTPLHMAVDRGQINLAELLIAKGADVKAKDNQGKTPLDLAFIRNNTLMVVLLQSRATTN